MGVCTNVTPIWQTDKPADIKDTWIRKRKKNCKMCLWFVVGGFSTAAFPMIQKQNPLDLYFNLWLICKPRTCFLPILGQKAWEENHKKKSCNP